MTIEQRTNNSAVQNSVKSFVFLLWFPLGDHFAVLRKTANMQSVWIRWAATEANVSRRIFFLERLFVHNVKVDRLLRRRCQTPSPKTQDLSGIKLIRRRGRFHLPTR